MVTISFDLVTLKLVLDIIVNLMVIVGAVFFLILLVKIDKIVNRFERSAESIESSTQTVEDLIKILRIIPFVGPKKKKN